LTSYSQFATLTFVFICDQAESELGVLDLIQVFVEALDRMFENVCELDLVFGFDEVRTLLLCCPACVLDSRVFGGLRRRARKGAKGRSSLQRISFALELTQTLSPLQVHHTLAEIIQGGLVLETNINTISANGESPPPLFFLSLFPTFSSPAPTLSN